MSAFWLNAQEVEWSVGSDPSAWISGWRNAQIGIQFHPEVSIVAGAGYLKTGSAALGVLRVRPHEFERATTANIGVRLHPGGDKASRVQGLVGVDYRKEVFSRIYRLNTGSDAEISEGLQQFERSDLRMLAGGRCSLTSQLMLSVHVGVGYAFRSDKDWLASGTSTASPSLPRVAGMELLWRL